MKRIKLKRKQNDYLEGQNQFKNFMTMNRKNMEKMTENEKEIFLFMGGFYSGVNYKKGE